MKIERKARHINPYLEDDKVTTVYNEKYVKLGYRSWEIAQHDYR